MRQSKTLNGCPRPTDFAEVWKQWFPRRETSDVRPHRWRNPTLLVVPEQSSYAHRGHVGCVERKTSPFALRDIVTDHLGRTLVVRTRVAIAPHSSSALTNVAVCIYSSSATWTKEDRREKSANRLSRCRQSTRIACPWNALQTRAERASVRWASSSSLFAIPLVFEAGISSCSNIMRRTSSEGKGPGTDVLTDILPCSE